MHWNENFSGGKNISEVGFYYKHWNFNARNKNQPLKCFSHHWNFHFNAILKFDNSINICVTFITWKIRSIYTLYWKVVDYGTKVGIISWILFHLIWKNYVLYWDFDLKSWIVDFFTRFTREKTPQNNFSSQNFSVENNYFLIGLENVLTLLWFFTKIFFVCVLHIEIFCSCTEYIRFC